MTKKRCPHLVVTAGPTREWLDPVRFLTNPSTGELGYKIAANALRRGFKVTLISGPTAIKPPSGLSFIGVETAEEMCSAAIRAFSEADALAMTAAVCDFRPKRRYSSKIKKETGALRRIELVRTPDCLKSLAKIKGRKILIGFALETEDLEKNALKKLKSKKLDIIIANRLSSKSNPFGPGRGREYLWIERDGDKSLSRSLIGTKSKISSLICSAILARI